MPHRSDAVRVILDTDLSMGTPGSEIDDGFALALAVSDPGITLELVPTVNGNTDVDTATRLTLDLLARLGHDDVTVARGAAAPLLRASPRSPAGLETVLPPDADPTGRVVSHAARHLVGRVMAEPGELTVVAIGPLTNLALALALEPRVATAVVVLNLAPFVPMSDDVLAVCDPVVVNELEAARPGRPWSPPGPPARPSPQATPVRTCRPPGGRRGQHRGR